MKKVLILLTIFLSISFFSFAQDRFIARGAEPGELYLTGLWYGIYHPVGPPYYDTLRRAVYRLTEHGKKLTIQYDCDHFADEHPGFDTVMYPDYILADATPGVVYSKTNYYAGGSYYTQLWVSFDYGKNWILRDENIGSYNYYSANFDGLIYRGGGCLKV
jgi:hypothetical protein